MADNNINSGSRGEPEKKVASKVNAPAKKTLTVLDTPPNTNNDLNNNIIVEYLDFEAGIETWFPGLLSMLVGQLLILPKGKTVITMPHTGLEHPLWRKMAMFACLVSGIHLETEDSKSCQHAHRFMTILYLKRARSTARAWRRDQGESHPHQISLKTTPKNGKVKRLLSVGGSVNPASTVIPRAARLLLTSLTPRIKKDRQDRQTRILREWPYEDDGSVQRWRYSVRSKSGEAVLGFGLTSCDVKRGPKEGAARKEREGSIFNCQHSLGGVTLSF
ncbi:hypothetical protein DPMN_172927 [Dreissena polymorpha]|uniref:Uncharacterized protein n=1 Tax=Dreissena polymorpha TaxID=45954 RepID=A0A9D4E1R5_DREPO|nr:hypothetical protein DPMN_172927 [Dreissena polymorpha]